ncbi:MAG: hypothetical protein IKY78_02540 [Clostridia bacterium]|nr:hypothetical protein [Clostridia bacterium]
MTKFLKKLMSLIIVIAMVLFVAAPMGASATVYPQGVTPEQAEDAIDNTDNLISGLLEGLADTSLKELAMPEIISDELLSLLLVEAYKALEKNAESMSTLGLDISVPTVAYYLSSYEQVSLKLLSFSSWEQVNLEGVSWGVTDKKGFATAASAMFAPLNSILYTLLCGGNYPVMGFIAGVQGDKGYENAIIPIYRTLGMKTCTTPSSFYTLAESDRYNMVFCIAYDLLTFVEDVLDAPAQMLTQNLPSIAHFITSGALENTIKQLLAPLRVSILGVPILSVDTFVDLSALEGGLDLNFSTGTGAAGELQIAPIDLEVFAACGTVEGDKVIPNRGDVYIEFLRWAIESIKLNQAMVTDLINSAEIDTQQLNIDINSLVSNLFSKPTDEIISLLVNLLAGKGALINDHQWSFNKKMDNNAVYTPNRNRDHFVRAVSEIDELVNQLVAEGGEYSSLRDMLAPMLYSNSLLTQLVTKLYSFLQGEDIEKFVSLLDIDLSPAGVSQSLKDVKYGSVASQLSNLKSWEYLNKDAVNWGFTDGDREGFISALSAALSPAEELLGMLLAGGKITLLDSIEFYGSDGYNSAIIPVLEALGVYYQDIPSYSEYLSLTKTEGTIKPIVESIFTLVERALNKPVYTVTEILPNLMYFLNNDGLGICIRNLIFPITKVLEQLGLGSLIDFSQLSSIDVNALIADLMSGLGISFSFSELNLSQFEGMGELVTTDTKRTQSGSPIMIYAVKADQPAVMVTVLRFAVETIKQPGNDSFILDLIGSNEEFGENSIINAFAQGIADKLNAMTVDEAVEWIYDVFFFERVTVDLEADDYTPEVKYVEKRKMPSDIITTIILIILMLAVVMILTNRDKIKFYMQDQKAKKAANK